MDSTNTDNERFMPHGSDYRPEHAAYMPGHPDSGAEHHVAPACECPPAPDDSCPSEPQAPPQPAPEARSPLDMAASFISWVLVPLMMPVYASWMLISLSPLDALPTSAKAGFMAIIFGINVLVPMLLVYLLKLFGLVQDVGLNNRKERLLPYIITILAFSASAWFVAVKGAPLWIVMFFAGGAVAGLINFLINFRWKISAHAAAIAGVVAILIRLGVNWIPTVPLLTWIIIWILLAGLLGSARVWLGRHTVSQVLAGYAVGFLSVYLLTML